MLLRNPAAADPARSRGRRHPEPASAFRDPYQRDRDRVVHSTAFRRLRGKTQVFVAPDGDHFRVRLTHSLEVAQIARVIARALGLNEDLTEAIALGHDLGHPPFGHAGEDALDAAMAHAGGFDHNGHTIRVLTRLEQRYPGFAGLNLSWEVLEGLAKHNGPVARPGWALAEADADWRLDLHAPATPEAQVAALADDIAYDNHDLDDGLRAGLFTVDDLTAASPFAAECWAAVKARWPGVISLRRLVPELVREQIGRMVADVVDAGAGHLAVLPSAAAQADRELKVFLTRAMYRHPSVAALRAPAETVVAGLFAAFTTETATLPPGWATTLPAGATAQARHVGDYIAGMTDRFAIREYARVVGTPPALVP